MHRDELLADPVPAPTLGRPLGQLGEHVLRPDAVVGGAVVDSGKDRRQLWCGHASPRMPVRGHTAELDDFRGPAYPTAGAPHTRRSGVSAVRAWFRPPPR